MKQKISPKKIEAVKQLNDLLKSKKTLLIVSIKNVPNSQFQEISKDLREKAVIKVPKKKLFFMSIDEQNNEQLKKIKEKIGDSYALLFSDLDSFELAGELIKNQRPAKAKPGQIAQEDIEIPEGPTDLPAGPAVSELGAFGIQIQIEKGKISIKEPKIIVKANEKISEKAADLLNKLNIKPFKIGLTPICAFDIKENKFFPKIEIDKEGTIEKIIKAYKNALPFAISIGYISEDTLGIMLARAQNEALVLEKVLNNKTSKKEE